MALGACMASGATLVQLFSKTDLHFTGTHKIRTGDHIAKALTRLRDEAVEIEGINYVQYLQETAP